MSLQSLYLSLKHGQRFPDLLLILVGFGCIIFGFNADQSLFLIKIITITIGLIFMVTGFFWTVASRIWKIIHRKIEKWRIALNKVIIIEIWGLRDENSVSLRDKVSSKIGKRQKYISIDIRKQNGDDGIISPDAALKKVNSLRAELERKKNEFKNSDISLVYGSLAPVPFTFLAGVLIGNKEKIVTLDWDRDNEIWRELSDDINKDQFQISGLDKMALENAEECAIAISVSYPVFADDIREQFGNIPIIEMKLKNISRDNHWSDKKQRTLVKQFIDTMSEQNCRKIKRVHLFLAAPSSLVFRFGRLYDDRNLPEIVVYQFQKNIALKYPWGVLMPVGGVPVSKIIKR